MIDQEVSQMSVCVCVVSTLSSLPSQTQAATTASWILNEPCSQNTSSSEQQQQLNPHSHPAASLFEVAFALQPHARANFNFPVVEGTSTATRLYKERDERRQAQKSFLSRPNLRSMSDDELAKHDLAYEQ